MIVPLPPSVRERLIDNTHLGLLLDKYVKSWSPGDDTGNGKYSETVQRPALDAVVCLSQKAPAGLDLGALSARRNRLLEGLQASRFQCVTTGPLTLHLARASALENAGICLHPLYGFVYVPGSGLKGMARAYAVLVWKPSQPDPAAAQATIEAVFGNEPGEPHSARQHAGAVVFHDAWPTQWPRLVTDILNNHHSKYYQGDDAPGDWENPVPVYFLAVPPPTTFEFALTQRTANSGDTVVCLAQEWLLGALCHFGAGAKTNSGYGVFKPVAGERPVLVSPRHATFETAVRLITPAFLAGANQQSTDCDLRSATLRGLLRWWWRSLHAGYVDRSTLRNLESQIWGDTQHGGAVQLTVEPVGELKPQPYDKGQHASMRPESKVSEYGIPGGEPRKTTQGLWYASYGMDERDKRRHYLDSGAAWRVRFIARSTGADVTSQQVLDQAKAAFWLLCEHGGVGSKGRKGFGSLAAEHLDDWDLETCRRAAVHIRQSLHLSNTPQERLVESASLGLALPPVNVPFDWPNVWHVLDQVGFAYQAFAKKYRHRLEKKALGLPRRVGSPVSGRFSPTGPLRRLLDDARRERREDNVRHASPIHIHIARSGNQFVVRTLAFPAPFLPDMATSLALLREFLDFFQEDLRRRAALPPPASIGGQATGVKPGERRSSTPPSPNVGSARRLPSITKEQLVQRLMGVSPSQSVFRVLRSTVSGTYDAQRLRSAPNVAAGYQSEGGWRVTDAPEGLPDGGFVLVILGAGREGKFIEGIGTFESQGSPQQRRGGPPRGRR